jgi:hypothetical protein
LIASAAGVIITNNTITITATASMLISSPGRRVGRGRSASCVNREDPPAGARRGSL